jgi:hypothetical protein
VSESQLGRFEVAGIITAIRVPGVRAVWHDAEEIQRVAENIRRGKLSNEQPLSAAPGQAVNVTATTRRGRGHA